MDDDTVLRELKEQWGDREILILAPGASIAEKKTKIDEYIRMHQPVVISANFIPEQYAQDYVFCSNAMRYSTMEEKQDFDRLLITSNLMDICDKAKVLNYAELCFDEKGKCDNCVIMLMKLLIRLGIQQVSIAGFDGYKTDECNYVSSYMASQHTKGAEENIKNVGYLSDIQKKMKIQFLTPSLYNR